METVDKYLTLVFIVYIALCRTVLTERTLSIEKGDKVRLFFDGLGKWVINDNAEHKVLPDHTRIIAVRGGVDGVLLLTSDGFSTANLTRWKCSDKYVDGWQEVSFNESGSDSGQWNTPHVLHKKRPVAFPPAQWINYTTSDKGEYFCRGKYECGCDHECEVNDDNSFQCTCEQGDKPNPEDETTCIDIDECRNNESNCDLDSSVCKNSRPGYTCQCDAGYEVVNHDWASREIAVCTDLDECDRGTDNCDNASSTCHNTEPGYSCQCEAGYEVVNHDWRDLGTAVCTDINECMRDNKCDRHKSTCVNTQPRYDCKCKDGFEKVIHDGTSSETVECTDIDECQGGTDNCDRMSSTCVNREPRYHCSEMSTICYDREPGYFCRCNDNGYEVVDHDWRSNHTAVCTLIDECRRGTDNCDRTSTICKMRSSGLSCECRVGFERLDLFACADIDECQDKSHDCNHICNNTVGSYVCDCKPGFVLHGGGRHCIDVDECAAKKTHHCEHKCANTYGEYLCTCPEGFIVQQDGACKEYAGQGTHWLIILLSILLCFMAVVFITGAIITFARKPRVSCLPRGPPMTRARQNGVTEEGIRPPSDGRSMLAANHAKRPLPLIVREKKNEPVYGNVNTTDSPITALLAVESLPGIVKQMANGNSFEPEFKSVTTRHSYKCDAALKEPAMKKTRFKDILPYDRTRVILKQDPEDDKHSDYINASYVDGYEKTRYYIATQGPKESTVTDFWRMVWQTKIPVIVMLTNHREQGRDKCAHYWNDECSQTMASGCFNIVLQSKSVYDDYVVRVLKITKQDNVHVVNHFHMTSWPDKSVPLGVTGLLEMRSKAKQLEASKSGSPGLIVHCSAGAGRTGTYIAIDYQLKMAEAENKVDICACLVVLRRCRMALVQTLAQYIYLYEAVLVHTSLGSTRVPTSELENHVNDLLKNNSHQLAKELEVLQTLQTLGKTLVDENATKEDNVEKNRSRDILPLSKHMMILDQTPCFNTTYINAICLRDQQGDMSLIVTQMPLPHTRVDFWRLANRFEAGMVIMLNEDKQTDNERYFPRDAGDNLIIEHSTCSMSVECESADTQAYQPDTRRLNISTPKWKHSVLHHSLQKWPDEDESTAETTELFRTIEIVQRWMKNKPSSPVIVHCMDGGERSGLFCALCGILRTTEKQETVDVFCCALHVMRHRPEFIQTKEQYLRLYQAVLAFRRSTDIYENA